jgi:hypothetical protein
MTQLRRDAAYIRTKTRTGSKSSDAISSFDETVCNVLTSAHTVTSAAKTLAQASPPAAGRTADTTHTDLEAEVAASMLRLLEADRIELSPDS